MTITINNRTFEVNTTPIDCWNYKITVYEGNSFIGKAITNDIEYALKEMIK